MSTTYVNKSLTLNGVQSVYLGKNLGIESYKPEWSVHLIQTKGRAELRLLGSCSDIYISFLILVWNSNPFIISVETTDYPIENTTFPTVTVCQEENEPNCFDFVAKILDYFPYPCFDDG